MNITEQQSRAFEKWHEDLYGHVSFSYDSTGWRYEGWQAALKFAEEQGQPFNDQIRELYPFALTQATECAGCGKRKHTPLRRDEMGGYVCLTCIDKRLDLIPGELEPSDPPSPQPPPGYHLATDEERKRLPEGSLAKDKDDPRANWVPNTCIGREVSDMHWQDFWSACPDAPALVTFTDGKIDPPPFGQWHREDWTPEMLAGGWRPLLLGEAWIAGDWIKRTYKKEWEEGRQNTGDILDKPTSKDTDHCRTRRPLPAPPAEEWVPLTAEDVPPGSALSYNKGQTWEIITKVEFTGVETDSRGFTWEALAADRDILRPGQDWQPAKKLKTSTP
jgi:hypothetical protein